MSPPIVGPNVTVQRPSGDTPEPTNRYPRATASPFQQPAQPTVHDAVTDPARDPSAISPRDKSGQQSSRAAQAYTPPLQHTTRPTRDGGLSSQATPQPRNIPVVTDGPSPTPMQQRPKPEDPRVTAFRNAAYNAPPLQSSAKQPEMQQKNRGNTPLMPSPDIRPPSDDTVNMPQQPRTFTAPGDSGASMPNLSIPSTYIPPTEERRPRDRSQSNSDIDSRPASGAATPRAGTPGQEQPKKSVKFNPKPEFSDAPSTTARGTVSDSEADSPDARRRRRHDRERERERDRDHDRDRDSHRRHGHGYDAGDDFSDDTPLEDHRRRSHDRGEKSDRDKDRDKGTRHSSRRERSNTQSLDRDSGSARERDRDPKRSDTLSGSSRKSRRRDRDGSPGSDTTIDLPPRFDEKGRKRPEKHKDKDVDRSPEQDVLAEKLDEILGGLFGGGSSSKKR